MRSLGAALPQIPKAMTLTVIVAAQIPDVLGAGIGFQIVQRIAAPPQPSPYRRWQAKYHLAVLQASPEALASAAGSPHLPYCKIVVVVIFLTAN